MQPQKKSRIFPSRLCPVSVVVLSLFASMGGAWADAGSQAGTLVSAVEFNDAFLRNSGGERLDVSRFNQGNVALPGTYRADIYVNQLWIGRSEVVMRQAGPDRRNVQPCFDRALLDRIGVDMAKLTPEASARLQDGTGSACTPLPDLIADATAAFDNGEQRLDISVPQAAMNRQARGYVDPKYWDDGVTAARLQYNASAYHSDSLGTSTTQAYLGLTAGVNVGAWRFRHTGSLSHDNLTGNHYQAIQTNLQRSIAPLKSQLVIGDGYTDGAMFDSFGFRGVQVASDDRMYPESQRGYAPTIHGIANSNARVQIRQNGNIIYETTVAAGAFEINDLYPSGYGGDLEVAVTEADGSVRISRVPYAPVVNALRPGVTRYSVTAGQYRNAGVHMTPMLLQGTVQHGFTNMITGYGGVVAAQDYMSVVLGAALSTDYGAIGADITHASTRLVNQPDQNGQSVRLSYSKLLAPTRTNLTLAAYRYSTSGFYSLPDAVTLRELDQRNLGSVMNGTRRGRLQAMISQSLPQGYGNFYLSGSTQDYWNRGGRDTQFQAGYNNSYKRITYGVSAARQLNIGSGKWENRVMLTVGIPLGRVPQAPFSTTSLQTQSSGVTSLQETVGGTLGSDNALSYSVNVAHGSGGGLASTTSVGGSTSYIAPMVTVTGNASKASNYSQVGAGISGGVVAYAGGVSFMPTMSDTLAIVEADGAAGAHVSNANGLRVDPWGHAVVPNLMPFSRNRIEIEPKDLPLNVELKSTMQQIAPTSGAVVKVKFDTESAGRAAILQVKMEDGKPLPFGAEVFDASGQSAGTVAQGGRIIARGLTGDSGVLTAKWGAGADETCLFAYTLPKPLESKAHAYLHADAACRVTKVPE